MGGGGRKQDREALSDRLGHAGTVGDLEAEDAGAAEEQRAVEAVRSHPEVDPARVAISGGSQGGGIALAAASSIDDLGGYHMIFLPCYASEISISAINNGAQMLRDYVSDGGSFTLTSGVLDSDPIVAGSSASMVNGAIHSFVKAAAIEMPPAIAPARTRTACLG